MCVILCYEMYPLFIYVIHVYFLIMRAVKESVGVCPALAGLDAGRKSEQSKEQIRLQAGPIFFTYHPEFRFICLHHLAYCCFPLILFDGSIRAVHFEILTHF